MAQIVSSFIGSVIWQKAGLMSSSRGWCLLLQDILDLQLISELILNDQMSNQAVYDK